MANENANAIENQSDTQLDFDEIEKALEEKLHQHEAELGFLEDEVKQIGDPEALGTVLLDTVWEQFTNQIAIQAGEDFIRDNNGLRLDLSKDAHEQTTDNFEQGKIATHNTKIDYQKRYDEYKSDLQTDPDMQVDIQKNMRYNEETKTYERYDKSTDTWVGKKRYNERLKVWEEFDPRTGEWKKNLAKDARKNFDTRSKDQKGTKTVAKDHVIAAAEQIRDPEAAAHVDRETRKEFAKSDANLNDMDSSANASKGDLPMEDWLDNPRKDGQSQAEYFGLDEEELRAKDRSARKEYKKMKEDGKKQSILTGKQSRKEEAFRISKKAVRAAVMQLIADLVKRIVVGVIRWIKSVHKSLNSLLNSIKNAVIAFVSDLKKHIVHIADVAATVIATSILGPIVSTIRKAWLFIKQGWASLKQSIAYLKDPSNKKKSIGILMMEVGKIIMTGMAAVGAIALGDLIEKGLMLIPLFAVEIPLLGSLANIIGFIFGAIIAGIIGALAMHLINKLIAKKQKAELKSEIISQKNEIIKTQEDLMTVEEKRMLGVKDDAFHTIAERHIEAVTRIKESTETILANDQTAEEMLTDMGKDLEKLLGDSEQ